jgi:thiamine-monophosphate kinase
MKTQVTENAVLNKIYSLSKKEKNKNLLIGPGDDCAAIKTGKNKPLLVTTDGLVEGTHFSTYKNNAKNLARKLVRSNLSDFAAMGDVKPLSAVCAAGFAPRIPKKWVDNFTRELFNQSKKFGFTICGGNIARSKKLHLYLTVFGFADPAKIIKRSSAKPKDLIYGVGNIGHSKAGAELSQKKSRKFKNLIRNFWEPEICIKQSKIIAKNKLATSMIDNSDGLYESAKQLALASKCRAKISVTEKLVSPELKKYCQSYHKNPKDYILYGGEDYGLIFTVNPKNEKKLLKLLPESYRLGIMQKGSGIRSNEHKKDKTFVHF